jgi:hypothetical protein
LRLIPDKRSIALGTVTFLSDEQIAMLDGFEGQEDSSCPNHESGSIPALFWLDLPQAALGKKHKSSST